MADTIQLGALRGLGQDFEDEFLNYSLGTNLVAFNDVNAEESELNQYIYDATHETPLSSPPALSASTGPSPSTSYMGHPLTGQPLSPITPPDKHFEPVYSTPRYLESSKDAFDIDEFIKPDAYQAPLYDTIIPSIVRPPLASSQNLPQTTCDGRSALRTTDRQPSVVIHPTPDPAAEQATCIVHPSRSLSKRGRTETSGTMSGLTPQLSKRHKQIENGFPCREECGKVYHRQCDEKKHYTRTHASEDVKKHSCPACTVKGKIKRFLYPKDVLRHLHQVHHIQPINTQVTSSTKPQAVPEDTSPTSPSSPGPAGFWTLHKAVLKFKNLRISAKSPQEEEDKMIMVSHDTRTFFEVDVAGVSQTEILGSRILSALDVTGDPRDIVAHSYSRRNGRTHLGTTITMLSLLNLISVKANSEGTLKFIIKPAHGPH